MQKHTINDLLRFHQKDPEPREKPELHPDIMSSSFLMPGRSRVDACLLIMLPKCPAWNTLVSPSHHN